MPIIRYYVGSMFAGKSYQALELLHSEYSQHKIIVAPTARKRGFITRKESLTQLDSKIHLFEHLHQIPAFLLHSKAKTIIMIDEVQFNHEPQLWQLISQAQRQKNLHIILVALEFDQHANFFPNHAKLLSLLDPSIIRSLYVSCATCDSNQGAISIRKWHSSDRITDDYAVLCQTCFQAYFAKKSSRDHCFICPTITHYLHPLRQWQSDLEQEDSYARLCGQCYHKIQHYGLSYKEEAR